MLPFFLLLKPFLLLFAVVSSSTCNSITTSYGSSSDGSLAPLAAPTNGDKDLSINFDVSRNSDASTDSKASGSEAVESQKMSATEQYAIYAHAEPEFGSRVKLPEQTTSEQDQLQQQQQQQQHGKFSINVFT